VDAAPEEMKERLVEANGGRKVDIVFEMAGGEVFDQSLRALAPFGRLVAYGIASSQPNTFDQGSLMRRSQSVVGFWLMHCMGRPEMVDEALADLFARASRGELRAVVGATYPLADAARAQEDLAGRRTTGKVMLDPSA
jgi:NADPH:quinone reductase